MAQELDDGEFWLPSEFLTDDDFKTEKKSYPYGYGSSFGLNTDLCSPVESVTETESDEDEFVVSVLAQKIANTTFNECNFSSHYAAKGLKLSGSPQSTLCGCKNGSTWDSPNCGSRVRLNRPCVVAKEAVGLDLLYAAAEEIARMRLIEQRVAYHSANRFAHASELRAVAASNKNPNSVTGFDPNQNPNQARLSYQQFQQMMGNGAWNQLKNGYQLPNGNRNGAGKVSGLPISAWPTPQQSQQLQQQHPGSGMRAVFLGETGPKNERTGTGVFLPQRFGANNPSETRKKPGCSVLLPDRVVHALNLNLDSVNSQPQIRGNSNGYFTSEYDDAALKHVNNVSMDQQRRNNLRSQRSMMMNQEIRLPQEWTY